MERDSMEKGIISRTPAKIKEKEGPESNFRGRSPSNAYAKVRSRYLGGHMGSCHDLCKYGHKSELEDDGKHAIFRRFMANGSGNSMSKFKASDKSEVLQVDKIAVSSKHSTIELKTPSIEDTNTGIPRQTVLQDSPNVKANIVEVSNSSKKKMNQSLNSSKKKKNQAMKPKNPPVLDPSPVKKDVLELKTSPVSAKITSGSDSNISIEKTASYMKETIASSALKLNNQKKKSFSDGLTKSAIHSKTRFPTNLQKNLNGSRILDRKVKTVEATVLNPINLKARKFRNIEHGMQRKGFKSEDYIDIHEIVQEKSEDKAMVANNHSFSFEDDGYTSQSSASDVTDSEIDSKKVKHNHERLEEGGERIRRRAQALQLNDDSSLPYKMKFKRGKVLELLPAGAVGPRRLRFRKGRIIDRNSNGDGKKRLFRRRGIGDIKPSIAEAHANPSEAIAVMLKHQDSQEKKDVRSLFNHVIEETASKLVKARKSKVKALVGAFETVILLQENKTAHVI